MKTDDNRNILKDTKYCTLIESAKTEVDENGYQYAIENIVVKELNRDEIRLCIYKDVENTNGITVNRLVPRPIDVTEDELIELIKLGIQKGILSKTFITKLSKKES